MRTVGPLLALVAMRRPLAAALLTVGSALLALVSCSSRSGHPAPGGSLSAAATSVATTSSARPRAKPTPAELAKRHAPIYRFNAWRPSGSSVQNRSEDFFPQSVVHFFDELAAKRARLSTRLGDSGAPGVNEETTLGSSPTIDAKALRGTPRRMAGDEPGTAPVYFHAFEDTRQRVRRADGSGEDLWFVEYWVFYPHDLALVKLAALPFALPIGGHRGDWESTSFAVALVLGPAGAFQRSEVRRGYFNGHGDKLRVERAGIELAREHPAVYVSIGKHASFPEPGEWLDRFGLAPAIEFDELFLGNGLEWPSEGGPLVDLDGPPSNEFSPPSFIAIPSRYADWRDLPGGWGPDPDLGPLSGSPVGPRFARVFGEGDAGALDWSSVKAGARGLTLGAVPRVTPAPVPIRR